MDAPTIAHNADRYRYEILIDGEVVGLSKYRDSNGQREFRHTEINEAFQGRGLATQLIRWALDDTREADLRIVASCPMVAGFVAKHHDYDDILDAAGTPPA